MRGLRLFVRPIEANDSAVIREFLARHGEAPDGAGPLDAEPACGLLGKLLGDVVAVVTAGLEDDALVLERIVVAPELRRKHIGRAMLLELASLAGKLDRHRVVVRDPAGAGEFLRRVGFELEGDVWVLAVREEKQR